MNDRDDPILDSMLDEVLGGRTPPDLTARIMQSLAIRGVHPEVQRTGDPRLAEPPAPPLPPRAIEQSTVASSNGHTSLAVHPKARSRKASSVWQAWAAVSLVVVLGVGLGVLGVIASRNPGKGNVVKGTKPDGDKGNAVVKKTTPIPSKVQGTKPSTESPLIVKTNPPEKNSLSPNIAVPSPEETPVKPAPSSGFPERNYAVICRRFGFFRVGVTLAAAQRSETSVTMRKRSGFAETNDPLLGRLGIRLRRASAQRRAGDFFRV